MAGRTKHIILAIGCTLGLLPIAVWYTLPVLGYVLFVRGTTPDIRPRDITLPEPPAEWDEVAIGSIRLKLPPLESRTVSGSGDQPFISFRSGSRYVGIFEIDVTEAPATVGDGKISDHAAFSYQLRVEVARSSPADISLFNTRARNFRAAVKQVLKGVMAEGLYEIGIVDPRKLKAVYWKRLRGDARQAAVDVYDQSETCRLMVLIGGYQDEQELDATLSGVLAGISLPEGRLDLAAVRRDIRTLIDPESGKGSVLPTQL